MLDSANLAPVVLFVYNRPEVTRKTVEALKQNYLSNYSKLFIFSDAPKSEKDVSRVQEVRRFISTISGFKEVNIIESPYNLGLAKSVIRGVNTVITEYGKVIVLEDDLLTSRNFLDYMNSALEFYKDHPRVFSISGYSFSLKYSKNERNDIYFGYRASSWGWGTWSRSWDDIDWEITTYSEYIKQKTFRKKFLRGGEDMLRMLNKQMKKKIDSWAIRWCYNQTLRDQLTVFPKSSKVYHIGGGSDATHVNCVSDRVFHTALDCSNKRDFKFSKEVLLNKSLLKQFKYKFSYLNKSINYMKSILNL